MLTDAKSFASFSTDDLEKAQMFYGETLGLNTKLDQKMHILELHLGGGAQAMVYPKDNHVPATFTILNFLVEDIEQTVDALIEKGVQFEQYDMQPYMKTNEKGIAASGDHKMAWFKDPAGNILAILQNH